LARVPNAKFSFLSTGEIAELRLTDDYERHLRAVQAERDKDREAAAQDRRDALRARERDKRIE
jgi:hypothetical protein